MGKKLFAQTIQNNFELTEVAIGFPGQTVFV